MAIAVQQIRPVAHLPLVLGVLRRLEVASLIDDLIPPHPAHMLSTGRGVEAMVLAILDGDHALYKVGQRLEERGMLELLQCGLSRVSLHDYRLGHILDALFTANLNKVFGAIALKALEVYAIPTPWLHQDTTTIALYGAYEDAPKTPRAPRPAYGHSKDGRDDLKQVLLSLGVSGDGGLPVRLGLRDGNRSDSVETPLAIEEYLALGLEGVHGVVADSKAYSRRTLGVCLEQKIGSRRGVPGAPSTRRQQRSRLHLYPSVVGWDRGDSPLAMRTARKAGRSCAPAARPPGALWWLFGAPQPPARERHPHATPARSGRGDGHQGAVLELGATAEARLCPGHGALPLVPAGGAADHRGHHTRRGDPENPPASEARGGPAPDCTGVRPPRSLRLVLHLTAPG